MYSELVMDHFLHPRNKGKLEDADAVGKIGNPVCGDIMHIYIKVNKGRIKDIGWETMGCAAAIATSSMLSDLAKGKTLENAMKINKQNIADALEGLPKVKMHCSNLAAEGLHRAIDNYLKKDKLIMGLMNVLSREDAEAVFKSGITTLDELKKASIQSIARSVSNEGMEKIKAYLKK